MIRAPHAAGTFYPSDPAELREFCQSRLQSEHPPSTVRAVILPHAGYVYSGKTACRVLASINVPESNFLIGPNHWGRGSDFSLASRGQWQTPLGQISIDSETAAAVLEGCPGIEDDSSAHAEEHSLEVLLPLLQIKNPALKILPLVVGTSNLARAREVAGELGNFFAARPGPMLTVVSSDMSHYEDDAATRKKDRYALDAILNLDDAALARVVREYRITMCGFVPVYMLLLMKDALGLRRAALVDYRTSADATGERDSVVGYAGFIFE